jgi:hypothetical protein
MSASNLCLGDNADSGWLYICTTYQYNVQLNLYTYFCLYWCCPRRVCDNWSTALHTFLSCRGFAFHSLSCDWYGHCGFCAFFKFLQGHFINWGHYCARQRHLFWLSWYYNVCRVLLANYYRLMCGTPKHLLQACMAKRTVTQASPSKQDDQKTVCFVVIIVFSAPSEHNTI